MASSGSSQYSQVNTEQSDCNNDLPHPCSSEQLSTKETCTQQDDETRSPLTSLQETEKSSRSPAKFTPPDGGYGWVVVGAACLANIWIMGFIKSYSIFYVEIRDTFPDSTAYHASWIPAMLSSVGLLFSPITGAMCRKYTIRMVSGVGAFICFLGLLLSSFAVTLMQMVFSMGVLLGLGSGFISVPSVLIVNMYFDKRRALTSGICVSGNALGGFLLPPLLEYLLYEYGLHGALLIVAGLQLHILVSASLYRPTSDHALVQQRKKYKHVEVLKVQKDFFSKKSLRGSADLKLNSSDLENNQTCSCRRRLQRNYDTSVTCRGSFPQLLICRSTPQLSRALNSQSVRHDSLKKRLYSLPLAYDRKLHVTYHGDTKIVFKQHEHHLSKDNCKSCHYNESEIVPTRKRNDVGHSNTSTPSSTLEKFIQEEAGTTPSANILSCKTNHNTDISVEAVAPMNHEEVNLVNKLKEGSNNSPNGRSNDEDITTADPSSRSNIVFRLITSCFDWEVLKTFSMILSCISACLVTLSIPQALFYVHAHFTAVGIEASTVTKILSLTSMVDLCGRLGIGFVADLNVVPLGFLYFFCTCLAGICTVCFPVVTSVVGVSLALCGFGFGIGGFVVLLPTTLARNHGVDKLPASYSFVRMLMGVMKFASHQICGAVIDLTGGYAAVYYLMGSALILASVLQRGRDPKRAECASRKRENES